MSEIKEVRILFYFTWALIAFLSVTIKLKMNRVHEFPEIRELQVKLTQKGYYTDKIDNEIGPQFKDAYKRWYCDKIAVQLEDRINDAKSK